MRHIARRSGLLAVAIAAALPAALGAQTPTIEDLLQRLEQQEQAIKVLERKLEIQDETAKTAASSTPQVRVAEGGYRLQSADGKNQLRVRGTFHFDGRAMVSDEQDLPDTWQLSRVRPIFEGTLGGIYDWKFMPDFGQGRTVIQDAYLTARFKPGFQVTGGKFKSPVGLERLQSANDMRFVTRAYPTSLAPNRDIGVQVGGNLLGGKLDYAVAFMNGSNDGASSEAFTDVDVNSDKEWAGRLFAHPFAESDSFALRGLGLGLAATYTTQEGTAAQPLLGAVRSPAQATVFRYRTGTTPALADGERLRLAPQFYWYAGRFGLLGEYTEVSQDVLRTVGANRFEDTLDNSAWHLQASVFLTGEEESFRGFKPNAVFDLDKGTWGAWELVARIHEFDADDDSFSGGANSFADPSVAVSKATSWGLGLNWYLSQNVKWVLNYEQTQFDGGAPAGGDRDDEKAILTRVALGF